MPACHFAVLDIGGHLPLKLRRQGVHVVEIHRIMHGMNGRVGVVQQEIPVFLRQVAAAQANQAGDLTNLLSVDLPGHQAFAGPHLPLDQYRQHGFTGRLNGLCQRAQV